MRPNRIATYLAAVGGLATAVAVPVADLDTSSTAGVIAGLAAITTVVHKWLEGWQRYEEREFMEMEDRSNIEADSIPVDPHDHSDEKATI